MTHPGTLCRDEVQTATRHVLLLDRTVWAHRTSSDRVPEPRGTGPSLPRETGVRENRVSRTPNTEGTEWNRRCERRLVCLSGKGVSTERHSVSFIHTSYPYPTVSRVTTFPKEYPVDGGRWDRRLLLVPDWTSDGPVERQDRGCILTRVTSPPFPRTCFLNFSMRVCVVNPLLHVR